MPLIFDRAQCTALAACVAARLIAYSRDAFVAILAEATLLETGVVRKTARQQAPERDTPGHTLCLSVPSSAPSTGYQPYAPFLGVRRVIVALQLSFPLSRLVAFSVRLAR